MTEWGVLPGGRAFCARFVGFLLVLLLAYTRTAKKEKALRDLSSFQAINQTGCRSTSEPIADIQPNLTPGFSRLETPDRWLWLSRSPEGAG
jgi:hypothetical protein